MQFRPSLGHKFVRDINVVFSLVGAVRGQKVNSWT
jgi:hypothetical protein